MIIKLDIEEARVLQLMSHLAKDDSLGTWELLKDIRDQYQIQVPPPVVDPAPE
jgi:acyl carrier protein